MNKNKITIGILAGVATGLCIGVMFVTNKGKEVRKKMVKKGSDSFKNMQSKFDGLIHKFVPMQKNSGEGTNGVLKNEQPKKKEFRNDGQSDLKHIAEEDKV